jgi:hypothetical protein
VQTTIHKKPASNRAMSRPAGSNTADTAPMAMQSDAWLLSRSSEASVAVQDAPPAATQHNAVSGGHSLVARNDGASPGVTELNVLSLRDSPPVCLTRNAVRGALSAIVESNTLQKDTTLAVRDTADNATAEAIELDLMLRDNSPPLPTHNAVTDAPLLPRVRAASDFACASGTSRGAAWEASPEPKTRSAAVADQAAG